MERWSARFGEDYVDSTDFALGGEITEDCREARAKVIWFRYREVGVAAALTIEGRRLKLGSSRYMEKEGSRDI
jgi:hypothetical protein